MLNVAFDISGQRCACTRLQLRASGRLTCHLKKKTIQIALQRCNVIFFARFLGWISEGEFGEVNFSRVHFSGSLFCWQKTESQNSTQEFGSEIRESKIRFPEFSPKFGFWRRKIPCADFCPWKNWAFNTKWNVQSGMSFSFRALYGRRKTESGIEIFNREWKFQTENENFVRGEWFFFHAFERERIFLISGPEPPELFSRNQDPKHRLGHFLPFQETTNLYTTPTKGIRSKSGIFEGVVYELSEPKRAAKCTPPPGLQLRCSPPVLWGWWADCGVRLSPCKAKITLRGKNYPIKVHFMLVLKGSECL